MGCPPSELEGALRSLYGSYSRHSTHWRRRSEPWGAAAGLIVVCPNTIVSALVYDWIAGQDVELPTARPAAPGKLALFSNVDNALDATGPRTILVDSAQLESGEAMKDDFKKAAAREIEAVQGRVPSQPSRRRCRQAHRRGPPARGDEHGRQAGPARGAGALRGVGRRCSPRGGTPTPSPTSSASARFGSQLLCEQVVGRGLRRRSYEPNAEGMFEPEYAEIYGVPFAFIPSDRKVPAPLPPPPAIEVAGARRAVAVAHRVPQGRRLPGGGARRAGPLRPRDTPALVVDRALVAIGPRPGGHRGGRGAEPRTGASRSPAGGRLRGGGRSAAPGSSPATTAPSSRGCSPSCSM